MQLLEERKMFKQAGFAYCKKCKIWTKPAHSHGSQLITKGGSS